MKTLLLAATLLSFSAPCFAQDMGFGGMGGFGDMGMSIQAVIRYSESDANNFVAEDASVSMDMMGMNNGVSAQRVKGSITVLSANLVRVQSKTSSGRFDQQMHATIKRDRSGSVTSLRISAKEFGAKGQLFSMNAGAGNGMSAKAGDLACTGNGRELRCTQTIKIDMNMGM